MRKFLVLLVGILLMVAYPMEPIHGAEVTLAGTIEELNFDKRSMTILDYGGKTHRIEITLGSDLQIEGLKKELEDFYFGQEVDVVYVKNRARSIVGYEEEDPTREGFIRPGSRFDRGDILFISKDQVEITSRGQRKKYRITPNTMFLKRGQMVNINQVKEGDKVMLNFDSIYTSEVASMSMEDQEQEIAGVLKGKVELVDQRNKEVLLTSPSLYKEGKWIPYGKDKVKLKTSGKELYNGANKLSLASLNYFKGKEVYVAYDEGFSRMSIAKLNAKSGFGQEYASKVSSIEYNTGQMVVDSNLLHFNEGTIVLKNNRLVDVLNINKSNDVLVTVDSVNGQKNTSLVSLTSSLLDERIDESKLVIYKGRIEDISEYEVELGKISYEENFLELVDQKWKPMEGTKKFAMSDDTLIYDSDLKEEIEVSAFMDSRYIDISSIENQALKDRLEKDFYKNKAAYFIVRQGKYGNQLMAMNLIPDKKPYEEKVNLAYSSQAEIKDIDYEAGTMTLTKVKNFNSLNNSFEKAEDHVMDIKRATILLNDLPLSQDKIYGLRKGSKIYSIKERTSAVEEGYVILIED